ncbi:hypothetical protein AAV32_16475 [Kerstersia gyiorum]|uniref:Uncharacterized protein n=1 Tax=Kerstersia gyiorum TaxID=206506 RepID=A0A171KNJ1_9BURK|nr:hypothetical protein AAV32_16475 [Kerstersia gyiorum]
MRRAACCPGLCCHCTAIYQGIAAPPKDALACAPAGAHNPYCSASLWRIGPASRGLLGVRRTGQARAWTRTCFGRQAEVLQNWPAMPAQP